MNNIYLIGFMGTGKSTVAKEIQKFLPFQRLEMDAAIERVECMTIPEIFEKKGEDAFRQAESQLLGIVSKENNQIISCGGGIVLRQENIDVMKATGTVVRLVAEPEIIFERVNRNNNRPLVKGKKSVEDIKAMMDDREDLYKKAADITVDSGSLSPAEAASEVVKQLALMGRLN